MVDWQRLSDGERALLERLFWAGGLSRGELAASVDFSKSKANLAISSLIGRELIEEGGVQPSSGGRRPEVLRLSHRMGVLAGIDIGATSIDVALLAPDMTVLDHRSESADVRDGPAVVFGRVRDLLREARERMGIGPGRVLGIGVGVPGPVAFDSGMLVNPPLLPGWETFSIREFLAEEYAAPVFVDNDVNILALGTHWRLRGQLQNFLVIKVGTGIGCGIICHGLVYRGRDGSAGDVGHICVDPQGPVCHCGNAGCVEAMAAGPAIARMAEEAARGGESPRLMELLERNGALTTVDLGNASRAGDAAATAIVQQAGGHIGRMLAAVVNFFNPSHIFIGGGVARIGPLLLASIRQSVYQRSLALSTRHLDIQYVPEVESAGVIGAAVMAVQETMLAGPTTGTGVTPPARR
ncbi:ROK family protein [Azospirillum sp. TSH64]|uniref:ROK family protein n=1 Tax=Azospirillum sp. TSH64 TaxID=652740 RepID=UPI000D60B695|nr:ROK family protein [Azospirillum sp. TSH64]PWC76937.1 transcriptional regulator [Azospirillum sp. TSH64]